MRTSTKSAKLVNKACFYVLFLICDKARQNHKNVSVLRVLRWYEKEGDQLVGELPLLNINLTELQELFQESPDNFMFECYVIGPQQADYFQQKINKKIDLNSYDYFIDCDAL